MQRKNKKQRDIALYKIKESTNSIEILQILHTLHLVTIITKVTFLQNSENYNAKTTKKNFKTIVEQYFTEL